MRSLLDHYPFLLRLPFIIVTSFFGCADQKDKSGRISRDLSILDFSYSDTFTNTFSIKTSNSDTIYIKQHFSNGELELAPGMYFVTASKQFKDTLRSCFDQIQFNQTDTLYYEDYEDGSNFKVCTSSQEGYRCIMVHSDHAPKELNQLASFIVKAKDAWTCKSLDTTVYFASEKGINIADPDMKGTKFLPPE